MKWPLLLLALLIAMAAAASVAVVLGDRGDPSREIVHGQYPTMLQGDPGTAGHDRSLGAVWACGVLMLAFVAALLAWGYRRHDRPAWALAACLVLQAGLFSAAMLAYARFTRDPSPRLWWALPLPTAWLVYVFWPAQLVFVAVFVATFDRWFWRPVDEAAFRRIVIARREGENGTS